MKTSFIAVVVCLLVSFTLVAQRLPQKQASDEASISAVASERFVPMSPCRLLDTEVTRAEHANEERARPIDLTADHCGSLVPAAATAYAIRVTSNRRSGRAFPVVLPSLSPLVRYPASKRIVFPFGADEDIAIDIEGYYVPPGTVTDPKGQSLTSPGGNSVTAQSAGQPTSSALGPRIVHADAIATHGLYADLYLDGTYPNFYGTAFMAVGTEPMRPWMIMLSSESGGAGGFAIYNSTQQELMRVSSSGSGLVRLLPGNAFSGSSDYQESQNVPRLVRTSGVGNVVNNIEITRPRDANGTAGTPVVFFNAQTDDEAGSPAVTRFRAFTKGDTTQNHINFDSQIYNHAGNQYHYRAFSTAVNPGIDTFWIKPSATGADGLTGTRADMYVSGRVAIGTPSLGNQFSVNQASDAVVATPVSYGLALLNQGTTRVTLGSDASYAYLQSWSNQPLQINNQGNNVVFNLGGGNVGIGKLPTVKLDVAGDAHFSGIVTGGIIQATFQDLAEWVPAAEAMAAGTVVVVGEDADNTVTASMHAYDTSVAGVVSASPGLLLGVASATKAKIATTGRVRVRVDATKSPIRKGDLLVTSDRPGMAMKSEPLDLGGVKLHRPGTLIGKALEPLASGQGEILVLLSLQ